MDSPALHVPALSCAAQCIARVWSARRKLKKLRQDAREVGNIKQQNAELKQQNNELKYRVTELETEVNQLRAQLLSGGGGAVQVQVQQVFVPVQAGPSSTSDSDAGSAPTAPKSERDVPRAADATLLRASEIDEVRSSGVVQRGSCVL